jgi:deoxyribodipyrimidine photo-lyase
MPPVLFLSGGESEGTRRLTAFVQHRLAQYHRDRNNAAIGGTSGLSPYLHFGQIDPWTVALAVREADVSPDAQDALLDELLVRRELAFNFTHYNSAYDRFSGLPGWAQRTLTEHARDRRPGLPTLEELAAAQTGDELWNAGQRELLLTGTMHGWVRMYWGKRIIAWSRSPQEAFATTLYLNNRYALDGRDPVSYANIAWCFGKHDRPWPPRSIFGSIRTLTRAGAERRFDVAAYMQRIATLDDVSL